MESGWEKAWNIIKTVLMIVSFAFVILFIISLFTTNNIIDAGTKKQINEGRYKNGKNRFF